MQPNLDCEEFQEQDIFFYGQNKPNGHFSNFYPCSFEDEQCIQYNCSEQYFIYKKVLFFEPNNTDLLIAILREKIPSKIKAFGSKKYLKTFNEKKWKRLKLVLWKMHYDSSFIKMNY